MVLVVKTGFKFGKFYNFLKMAKIAQIPNGPPFAKLSKIDYDQNSAKALSSADYASAFHLDR